MSNVEYLGQSVDVILGQEFLTWLWFRGETANKFKTGGVFRAKKKSSTRLPSEGK